MYSYCTSNEKSEPEASFDTRTDMTEKRAAQREHVFEQIERQTQEA